MKEYEFTLKFSLPKNKSNPEEFIEKLETEGCDDALIGIGKKGYIALDFTRESESAFNAICSAIANVKKAIPEAKLIEANPDFVGLTDIAEFFGFTRQNMRKIMLKHSDDFPQPVHEGLSAIWHLFNILSWLKEKNLYQVDEKLLETAKITKLINITKDANEIEPSLSQKINNILPNILQE